MFSFKRFINQVLKRILRNTENWEVMATEISTLPSRKLNSINLIELHFLKLIKYVLNITF